VTEKIVYTSGSPLREPGTFIRAAARDLRRAIPLGGRIAGANLRARFRRTWLGWIWLFLPAAATTVVAVYVVGRRLLQLPATDIPYPAFVLAGLLLWQVFAEALSAPLGQLQGARHVITRSTVPHEAFLIGAAIETLVNGAARLAVGIPVLIALGAAPDWSLLWLPAALLALTVFGLSVGLLVAVPGLLYEDVARLLLIGTGLWLFLSPVFYPVGGLLEWNPVAPLLDGARAAMTGGALPPSFAIAAAGATLLLLPVWLLYRVARPHLVAALG